MSRLATARDFGWDGEPGVLYTHFELDFPFVLERAEQIKGRFANKSTKILIVGCAMGTLVHLLTEAGYVNVWGSDASEWAINEGKIAFPEIADRLLVADALNNSGNSLPSMTGVRRAAGLTGNQRFPLCITDDILTVMSDAECQTALTVLRATASTLFHVIWPNILHKPDQDPTLNWKIVPEEWQAFIGNGEWVMSADHGIVYGANGEPQ